MNKNHFLFVVLFFTFIFNIVEAQITITLQPGPEDGNDASIWSGAVTPYGDRESLTAYTWTNSGNLGLKRAFLMFDYSSIPENPIITNAKLSLFYNPTDPIESFEYHTGENDIYIQRIISEWDEHTLLWANQPGITMENQVELGPSIKPTQNYRDIDVTNLVIDMLDSSNGNYGFMIRMKDELNFYKSALFTSSDHIETALRPKLEITFFDTSTVPENEEAGFNLYPNPASQIVTIEQGFGENSLLEIINTHGQTIRKIRNIQAVEIIDISNFPKGIYLIQLVKNEIVVTKKLIVNSKQNAFY